MEISSTSIFFEIIVGSIFILILLISGTIVSNARSRVSGLQRFKSFFSLSSLFLLFQMGLKEKDLRRKLLYIILPLTGILLIIVLIYLLLSERSSSGG